MANAPGERLRNAVQFALHTGGNRGSSLISSSVKLNTPGKRAIYNNLLVKRCSARSEALHDDVVQYRAEAEVWALNLALQIDEAVRRVRPNAFRGNQAKENVIKAVLLPLLGDDPAEVERVFLIIRAQTEY